MASFGDILLLKSKSSILFTRFLMFGLSTIREQLSFQRNYSIEGFTFLCFFIISGKRRPFTANRPCFCSQDPCLLGTRRGRLIQRGTPITISRITQPRLHISTAQGLRQLFMTSWQRSSSYYPSFQCMIQLSISGGMYSGVAIENCAMFLNSNEEPQSMSLTSFSSQSLPSFQHLIRMFQVLRSECTTSHSHSRARALHSQRMREQRSLGLAAIA